MSWSIDQLFAKFNDQSYLIRIIESKRKHFFFSLCLFVRKLMLTTNTKQNKKKVCPYICYVNNVLLETKFGWNNTTKSKKIDEKLMGSYVFFFIPWIFKYSSSLFKHRKKYAIHINSYHIWPLKFTQIHHIFNPIYWNS